MKNATGRNFRLFAFATILAFSLGVVGNANAACGGDISGDGVVDAVDWLALLSGWGACSGDCPADISGDGVVDAVDWLAMLSDWGDCPATASCVTHDECALNEYCDGDGCFVGTDWDGPMPEGVCTPLTLLEDCAGEPIAPVCACNFQLRLSACELEVFGERLRNDGMCPILNCPNGEIDCPPNFHCVSGEFVTQCLPD